MRSSIASQSSVVILGLLFLARDPDPAKEGPPEERLRVIVFTPKIADPKSSLTYRSIPSTMLTTTSRNITPTMTPNKLKKLLSF